MKKSSKLQTTVVRNDWADLVLRVAADFHKWQIDHGFIDYYSFLMFENEYRVASKFDVGGGLIPLLFDDVRIVLNEARERAKRAFK